MKFLKNRYGKSSNTSTSTSAIDPDLKTRRIIKGTIPPTATDTDITPNIKRTSADENDIDHMDERSAPPPLLGTLAQKKEVLLEKSEIWRKERLDVTNKLRKEHKQQEIMEHRFNLRNKSENKENANDKDISNDNQNGDSKGERAVSFDVPHTFSVENTFPEHKRKSRSVDHDTGKKLRSEDGVEERAVEVEEEVRETWHAKAAQMIKVSGPGVLVAMVAIVAVRFLRK